MTSSEVDKRYVIHVSLKEEEEVRGGIDMDDRSCLDIFRIVSFSFWLSKKERKGRGLHHNALYAIIIVFNTTICKRKVIPIIPDLCLVTF